MADNLLDKASILLTPTAYRDGGMLSVKPNENLYGSELVTNGDFATDSDWSKGANWTISGGKANCDGVTSTSNFSQVITSFSGKTFLVEGSASNVSQGFAYISLGGTDLQITVNSNGSFKHYVTISSGNSTLFISARNNFIGSIDNISVKEDLTGDFQFSRSSAATRVNAQGLVENVQIISSELVSNGNFSQIGTEEVSNGNFSQEGSELVTNGDFATDSNWNGTNTNGVTISNGSLNYSETTLNHNVSQGNVVTIGKSYKVTLTVSNYVKGSVLIIVGAGGSIQEVSSNGTFTMYGVASINNTFYFQARGVNGTSLSIDNVSVKEVGQDWTLGTGWSVDQANSKAVHDSSAGATAIQSTSVSVVVGKKYELKYTASNLSGGYIRAEMGGLTPEFNFSDGTYTYNFTATTNANLYITASANVEVTNISVKEVGQDWTLGTGWSVDQANSKTIATSSPSGQSVGQNSVASSLSNGSLAQVSFQVLDITQGSFGIYFSGTLVGSMNSAGTFNGTFIKGTETSFYIRALGTTSGSITNISVKEITDDTDLPRINYEGFSYQDSLGSELVVNGGFANNSWWTFESGVSVSNNKANFNTALTNYGIYKTNLLTSNKSYQVQFEITNYTSGGVHFNIGGVVYGSYNSVGVKTLVVNSLSGTNVFGIQSNSGGAVLSIDNVSVKEVLGQEVVPDSGCGSWLLEPQSTNLITYSDDFLDSSWSIFRGSITANSIISPDGTLNASKYQEDSQTGSHIFRRQSLSITNGLSYTGSIFAKKAELTSITLQSNSSSRWVASATFDLENGTVTSGTGVIKDYGNGWYRCSISGNAVQTTTAAGLEMYTSVGAGRDGDGLFMYGAMFEQSSYLTSYIPTNGATSTRLQDIANNSGNSTLINSTEGVLYAEMAALAENEGNRCITISANSSNKVMLRFGTLNRVQVFVVANGALVSNELHTLTNITDFNKFAFKYKSGDNRLFVNGSKVDDNNDTFSFTSDLNKVNFNEDGGQNFFGKNKALVVYKEALTDANLRSLTYPNPVATTFDLDFDTIAEQFTFTRGSEATFVNAQGLIESTASNDAPRIDYSTGAKAFLLEPQSTNLITYSEDLSNSSWTKSQLTESLSDINSPDGTQNAYKLTESNSSSKHQIFRSIASYTELTISFFAKKAERSFISVEKSSWGTTIFNLNDGSVVSGNGSVVDFGNGWYRCSASYTASPAQSQFYILLMQDGSTTSYQGDGTSGLYLFGIQAEQQSYATSYIPTSGATATRNQELCNNATPVINSEEGTLYAEISALNSVTYPSSFITISDGTYNNRASILFSQGATNQIRTFLRVGGATQIDVSDSVSDVTDFNKIAFSYKLNDFKVYINGALVSSDTSGSVWSADTITKLSFSEINTNAGGFFGNTKDLQYYPKALADVQLEDLTTI